MNELGLYEIYGLSYVPFWQRSWFFWGSICATVILCILIIFISIRWYFRRKKNDIRSYWQDMLIKLNELKKNNVATVAQGSLFYARLTHVLKEYIQMRYQLEVRGRTDTEVLAVLEGAQFDPQLLAIVRQILQGGEYIKFANVAAVQQQIEKDLQSSIAFIEATHPRPDVK